VITHFNNVKFSHIFQSVITTVHFVMTIVQSAKCLPVGVGGSLYVDDFCICFSSKSVVVIDRQIQRCFNGFQKWVDENRF